MKMKLVLLFFMLIVMLCSGATYYIDSDAANGGDGTTTATSGANCAWNQLSDITGLAAGDIVKLQCGDSWRESLIVANSGTNKAPITFTSYGTGAKPIIYGSETATVRASPADGEEEEETFETGEFTGIWDSADGNCDTYTNFGIAGPTGGDTYGAEFADNEIGQITLSSVSYDIWIEFDVRPTGTNLNPILTLYDAEDTIIATLRAKGGTGWNWWSGDGSSEYFGTATANTWYKISIQVLIEKGGDGTGGVVHIWIDGIDATPNYNKDGVVDKCNLGSNPVEYFKIADTDVGAGEDTLYYDNIRWSFCQFDTGAGKYACGMGGATWKGINRDPSVYVDGTDLGFTQANLVAVDSTGEFYYNTVTDEYWFYDNLGSSIVEIPVARHVSTVESRSPIVIGHNDYIIIDGLQSNYSYIYGVNCATSATSGNMCINPVIRNCTFVYGSYLGIAVGYGTIGPLIESNEVYGFKHGGIVCMNGITADGLIPTNVVIRRNYVHDNYNEGIAFEQINGAIVEGNIIYNTLLDDNDSAFGLYICKSGNHILSGLLSIYNNTIYGVEGKVASLEDCLVLVGDGIIDASAWSDSETDYDRGDSVTNNGNYFVCVVENHNASTTSNDEPLVGSDWQQYWRLSPLGRVVLYNNIFVVTDVNADGLYYHSTNAQDLIESDYNCFYHVIGGKIYRNLSGSYTWPVTQATLVSETGQETNSIFSNPSLMAPANGDFRLKSFSPALNSGKSTLGNSFTDTGFTSIGVWQRKSFIMRR